MCHQNCLSLEHWLIMYGHVYENMLICMCIIVSTLVRTVCRVTGAVIKESLTVRYSNIYDTLPMIMIVS